jgi:tryptophan halogenase
VGNHGHFIMVRKIVIVGGGTAGFMTALAIKTRLPQLQVVVIRSNEIGIIGVGEGSGIPFTQFMHDLLRIPMDQFVRTAKPSWKLGSCFVKWGPRERFFFPFGTTLDARPEGLSKPTGYYCGDDLENASIFSALMAKDRVFERNHDGSPIIRRDFAYHIENETFAAFLEDYSVSQGVRIITDTVRNVRQGESGITGLDLNSGATETADLYVDCSGFRSLLLGKTFNEPFISYSNTLFCDRAVIGGWDRTSEVIHPYTIAETMNSGWCWQIEHPNRINRGYVYSSAFISDEEAEREFRQQNPKIETARMVKFVSGRYERSWVKNVVAIGNASGFVEPLEATALVIHATRAAVLAETLEVSDLDPTEECAKVYNRFNSRVWDSTRRFLATHYRFNTRLNTPFWQHCREHTDMGGSEDFVEWYRRMGPSPFGNVAHIDRLDIFGIEGYLTTLLGQRVPHRSGFVPSTTEMARWSAIRQQYVARAQRAMTVPEALDWFLHREDPPEPVQARMKVMVLR